MLARVNSRLPVLAVGLASIALITTLAVHVPRLRALSVVTAMPPPTKTARAAATPKADYSVLSGLNLLGASPVAKTGVVPPALTPPADSTEVEPTRLPRATVDFTLRGVAYSPDAARAYAIVAAADGSQKRYGIGDSPQRGITVERITSHEIVVRHAGRLERVSLPKPQAQRANSTPALRAAAAEDTPTEDAPVDTPPAPPETLPAAPPDS